MKGRVTASALNVRKNASNVSPKVGLLQHNELVTISNQRKVSNTIWYCIGPDKWVSGKYIELLPDIITPDKKELVVEPGMSMYQIQKILEEEGQRIRFVRGHHRITRALALHSDTTLILEQGAFLIRCTGGGSMLITWVDPNKSYDYNATKNITICGRGTLLGDGYKSPGSILSLFHTYNFNINGVVLKNVYKSHAIDMAGSKKVLIEDIDFSNRTIDQEAPYKEEIQYDFAYHSGIPYYAKNARVYNYNHCEDIMIKDCTFSDANVCIGTHTETVTSHKHKNIKVVGCKANGVGPIKGKGSFLNLVNVDGADIKNNTISGFARAFELSSCPSFRDAQGNRTTGVPKGKTGCKNINFESNSLKDAKGTYQAPGIFASSKFDSVLHENIVIKNNVFRLHNSKAKFDICMEHVKNVMPGENDTQLAVKIK